MSSITCRLYVGLNALCVCTCRLLVRAGPGGPAPSGSLRPVRSFSRARCGGGVGRPSRQSQSAARAGTSEHCQHASRASRRRCQVDEEWREHGTAFTTDAGKPEAQATRSGREGVRARVIADCGGAGARKAHEEDQGGGERVFDTHPSGVPMRSLRDTERAPSSAPGRAGR